MNVKIRSLVVAALAAACTFALAACSGGGDSMKAAVEICDPVSAKAVVASYKANPKRDAWTPERKEFVGDVDVSSADQEFLTGCSVDAEFIPGNPMVGMATYGPGIQIYVLSEGSSVKDVVLDLRESHQGFQESGQDIPAPQYYVRSDDPRIIAVNMNVFGVVKGDKAETQQHQVDEALTSHGWVGLGSAW